MFEIWHHFVYTRLYPLDALVSGSFGAYLGYAIQLAADSGEINSEKLMSSMIVGLFSFIFAFVVAVSASLRFKSIPSWVLLAALGPLFFVIGIGAWRYQAANVGPGPALALIIVFPFLFVLLATRCVALFVIFLFKKRPTEGF